MRLQGFLTVASIRDASGKNIPLQQAVDYGWVRPCRAPAGWDIGREEVPLGHNLFTDAGRQMIAYLLGGRAPISDFFIQKFGMGTGITPAAVTDVALESPVDFGGSVFTKAIDSADFPAAFILRANFTIGAGEGNGFLLTEFGMFTGSDVLVARWLEPGINKTSDFAPTLMWRWRA